MKRIECPVVAELTERREGSKGPHGAQRPIAAWRGESLNGKTLLIRAGAAPADTLFGFRYVAHLASRGADIVIQVDHSQRPLLARMGGVRLALDCEAPVPPADFVTSFDALDQLLEPSIDPRSDSHRLAQPYLRAERARVEEWRERLRHAAPHAAHHVLLAFGETQSMQPHESIPSTALGPLWALEHVHFTIPATCVEPWERGALASAPNVSIVEAADLDDQVCLARAAECVVAVDSSIAHVAGAVGARGYVLLSATPDWRWLRARGGLGYYPTLAPIRQMRVGDWREVIERVARLLGDEAVEHDIRQSAATA